MPQSAKPDQAAVVQTQLAESDEAVYNLLESLLQEVDEIAIDEPQLQTEVEVVEVVKVSSSEPIVQAELQQDEVVVNDLPDWTEHPISCLLFEVEGVEIAVPLAVLRSIDVWEAPAVPIPTQPDWHLGVMQHRDEKIVIVDTARLIMPEKITASADQRRKQHGSHFLVVNEQWALSCDGIHETIKITPDQVRWRPQRPTRPWAVGTLIDRLCVLMDTEALIKQLKSAQESR